MIMPSLFAPVANSNLGISLIICIVKEAYFGKDKEPILSFPVSSIWIVFLHYCVRIFQQAP